MIYGLDIGTTTSIISHYDGKLIRTVSRIDSCLRIGKNGVISVGKEARKCQEGTFVYEFKRLLCGIDDELLEYFSYDIDSTAAEGIKIKTEYGNIRPETLYGYMIKYMVDSIGTFDKKSDSIIITLPTKFNSSVRSNILKICESLGIKCERIITEPVAATIFYGYDTTKEQKVLVYDIGGGTLDISIVHIADGLMEVQKYAGDPYLGGANYDIELMKYCIDEFVKDNVISDEFTIAQISLLRDQCESAKKTLSDCDQAIVYVPDFYDRKDLNIKITLEDFNNICYEVLSKSVIPLVDIYDETIDDIIMVGGMSKCTQLIKNIELGFTKPRITDHPFDAISHGAAILGYNLKNKMSSDLCIVDMYPLSVGIRLANDTFDPIVQSGVPIPCEYEKKYNPFEDNIDEIFVDFYEGLSENPEFNHYLGKLNMKTYRDIRENMEISVSVEIDINRMMKVRVKDEHSNSVSSIFNEPKITLETLDEMISFCSENAVNDHIISCNKKNKWKTIDRLIALKTYVDKYVHDNHKINTEDIDKMINECENKELLPIINKQIDTIYESINMAKIGQFCNIQSKCLNDILEEFEGKKIEICQITDTDIFVKVFDDTKCKDAFQTFLDCEIVSDPIDIYKKIVDIEKYINQYNLFLENTKEQYENTCASGIRDSTISEEVLLEYYNTGKINIELLIGNSV